MKDKETPLRLVRKWEKMLPGVYSILDDLHAAKDSGEILWPDYCELPIGAAFTYLVSQVGLSKQDAAMCAAELTACWTWRQTKKIYLFDPNLAKSLAEQAEDTKDTDILPSDLLLHLPYPCIYIKAPGLVDDTDGFWFWDEYDINEKRAELRIQWVTSDMGYSVAQVLHLLPGATIKDCVIDTIKTTMEHLDLDIKLQEAGVEDAKILLSAIQLVLYLLSENAEIVPIPKPVSTGQPSGNITRLKKSEDKAGQVDGFSVGIRIGAALRKAVQRQPHEASASTGPAKRSHTRRGHWHHYWTGPMNGDRKLILKWTAPTVIHPGGADEDNIVIYPVKNP